MRPPGESIAAFACFGSSCTVLVDADRASGAAERDTSAARERLRAWDRQFSRFDPASELCRLNRNPDETVAVTPLMGRFAQCVHAVGELTGGLVDATLVSEIEHAGYTRSLERAGLPLRYALATAPPRRPAGPQPHRGWRELKVDFVRGTVTRPRGLRLDSGGLAKGMFVDVLSRSLARHASFAVDLGGDVRLGGVRGVSRPVQVASPFDDRIIHAFALRDAAVATSGIGKRSWLDRDGQPVHHLLDPSTGEPAYTGIVQVTAIAPTGVIAEALSKAALLSGPIAADRWLSRGGVVVYDDGTHRVVDPR